MSDILSDEIVRFVRATLPEEDAVLAEMDAHARERNFPHVGPEVGAALCLIARLVGARRIFEFGSGYGYSAYWLADALPADGEIVLTELNRDDLETAREFMARGGFDDRVHYEHGDALDAIERYEGPFDVVLLDHQNERYRDAFDAVRDKVAPGGVVVADNVIAAGDVDFEALLALVEKETIDDVDASTASIAAYLDAVQADPDFETMVLPLGEGISVSVRS